MGELNEKEMNNVIDIRSDGEYPANVLSNFSANAFVFDGVECASMEGFLQALKYRRAKKQKKICALVGKAAKSAGSGKRWWKLTGNVYWQGKRYKRDSKEFDELRLRAYKAMFDNDTFKIALQSAKGKILTHKIGEHDKRLTILTEEEFIGYLYMLIEML